MHSLTFGIIRVRRATRRLAVGAVLALCATHAARAQAGANSRSQSVDLTLGRSAVRGGGYLYHSEGGVSLDVLIAIRRPSSHGFFGALSAGTRFDADNSDDCVVVLPNTACLPNAPTISHLAALVGYEVRRGGASLRGLVGPSYFGLATGDKSGVRAQLSAAVGSRHVALTSGVSGSVIAPFDGSAFRYVAGHFGLRIQ